MIGRTVLVCSTTTLALLANDSARAQSLQCVVPIADKERGCVTKLASRNPSQIVVVRVIDGQGTPIAGVTVSFAPSLGSIVESDRTNSQGLASAEFTGKEIFNDVSIKASAKVDQVVVNQTITLRAMTTPLRSDWRIAQVHHENQSWFAERQLLRPIRVDVDGITPVQCDSATVRFKAVTDGASTTPDTSRAAWNAKTNRCTANGRWRLGKEIGDQYLRIELVGTQTLPVTIAARSRSLPRIMGGLAYSLRKPIRDYRVTRAVTGSLKIGTPSGELTRDSATLKVDSAPPTQFAPVLGVDWAPLVGMPRFSNKNWAYVQDFVTSRTRLMIGFNPNNAKDEWMIGLSLMEALWGFKHEAAGFDLHLAGTWRRQSIITNPAECFADPTARTCDTKKAPLVYAGLRTLVIVDGTALLKEVLTLFPVF